MHYNIVCVLILSYLSGQEIFNLADFLFHSFNVQAGNDNHLNKLNLFTLLLLPTSGWTTIFIPCGIFARTEVKWVWCVAKKQQQQQQ